MDVRDFDFNLPAGLIAQEPAAERAGARLLCLDRRSGRVQHRTVRDLPTLLRDGDVLVVNNTRVFPARLLGRREPSGGAVECLLIGRFAHHAGRVLSDPSEDAGPRDPAYIGELWEALMHPGQRLGPGARVTFDLPAEARSAKGGGTPMLRGEVVERRFHGRRVIRLWTDDGSPVDAAVDAIGHIPLPPYIKRADRTADRERYQTVFASERGSIAAPTAGLHLSPGLMTELASRGVGIVEITLHVGYGTFQPVRVARVEDHRLERERFEIGEAAAADINRALEERRRVIAVGTTTTRTLEAVARAHDGRIVAGAGTTDLFIYPGYEFRVIGGLLTNFHLPQSSLLLLVAAFAGRDRVLDAYAVAVREGYRFYSYGDAMLIG